mmetsp:Transcript_20668/g.29673  ORF Transcript_20668/g.29673 Transcript_20668/m.29673 type:complete len:83 (-) Transcript_20668:42-290(-)
MASYNKASHGPLRDRQDPDQAAVRDFATRFQDMIDEVTEKGYTTMEAAVQAISLREQEQDRKFTSPKVPLKTAETGKKDDPG